MSELDVITTVLYLGYPFVSEQISVQNARRIGTITINSYLCKQLLQVCQSGELWPSFVSYDPAWIHKIFLTVIWECSQWKHTRNDDVWKHPGWGVSFWDSQCGKGRNEILKWNPTFHLGVKQWFIPWHTLQLQACCLTLPLALYMFLHIYF